MTSTKTPCEECGIEIMPATARRTGGKCMPCSDRRKVHLSAKIQGVFEEFLSKLESTGWAAFLPHRREWLDLLEHLKAAVRRDPSTAYLALSDMTLSVNDCASPEACAWTIGSLRRMSFGLFDAHDVREHEDRVTFTSQGVAYAVDLQVPFRQRRDLVLTVANDALRNAGVEQRFHLLPRTQRNSGPLVFTHPDCLEKARALGMIPEDHGSGERSTTASDRRTKVGSRR